MTHRVQNCLAIYSSVVSTILLSALLLGAKSRVADFDEIRLHRLDVVEVIH